jgi:hypothetical protein
MAIGFLQRKGISSAVWKGQWGKKKAVLDGLEGRKTDKEEKDLLQPVPVVPAEAEG